MAQRRIDKQVVACFLESTKEVLEHISKWTVEVNARGQELPRGLTKVYGSARRLRDYLQRSLSAFPQPVLIDLSEDDENLLVGCFVHSVGVLDVALTKGVKTGDERSIFEQKRKVLADWSVEFAQRMPDRIPTSGKVEVNTPTVRGILSAITKKLSEVQDPGMPPPSLQSSRVGLVNPGFGGGTDLVSETADPPRLKIQTFRSDGPESDAKPISGAPALAGIEIAPIAASAATPEAEARARLTPSRTGGDAPETSRALDGVLEVQRLRDPRLRSMVGLDLRAFERAWQANDSRLALVHLYSIFEAGVLDHALGRRQELGLQSNVESWSLEGILQKSLGDRLVASDRGHLIGLISGRSLIRPAIQLTTPLAVTHASLLDAIGLVRRIFVELGLTGSGPHSGGGASAKPEPQTAAPSGESGTPPPNPAGSIGKTPGVWSGIWGAVAP